MTAHGSRGLDVVVGLVEQIRAALQGHAFDGDELLEVQEHLQTLSETVDHQHTALLPFDPDEEWEKRSEREATVTARVQLLPEDELEDVLVWLEGLIDESGGPYADRVTETWVALIDDGEEGTLDAELGK